MIPLPPLTACVGSLHAVFKMSLWASRVTGSTERHVSDCSCGPFSLMRCLPPIIIQLGAEQRETERGETEGERWEGVERGWWVIEQNGDRRKQSKKKKGGEGKRQVGRWRKMRGCIWAEEKSELKENERQMRKERQRGRGAWCYLCLPRHSSLPFFSPTSCFTSAI